MERIHNLVNEYLVSLGLCILYVEELDAIAQLLEQGRKVDAIKELRECTATHSTKSYVLRDGSSTFAAWLKNNGKTEYEKTHCLGLKEAKDIVDFIEDNM